jgi:hypothetical protein
VENVQVAFFNASGAFGIITDFANLMLCTSVISSFRDIEVALNAGDEVVPIGVIINLHVVLAVASKFWRIWSRLHTSKTLIYVFDLLLQCFVVALDFADSHMQEQCCLLTHSIDNNLHFTNR